jgi:hypothetical protein
MSVTAIISTQLPYTYTLFSSSVRFETFPCINAQKHIILHDVKWNKWAELSK